MILSMTGFGNATVECRTKKITIEIKSLNSKQLDLSSRVPQGYRTIEAEIRSIVQNSLERGKVELNMYVENLTTDPSIHLNMPALLGYKSQIEEASDRLGIAAPDDWWSLLMRFPDAIKNETAVDVDDAERTAALKAVSIAVDRLMEYRAVGNKGRAGYEKIS